MTTGRPVTPAANEENTELLQKIFVQNQGKSIQKAAVELNNSKNRNLGNAS